MEVLATAVAAVGGLWPEEPPRAVLGLALQPWQDVGGHGRAPRVHVVTGACFPGVPPPAPGRGLEGGRRDLPSFLSGDPGGSGGSVLLPPPPTGPLRLPPPQPGARAAVPGGEGGAGRALPWPRCAPSASGGPERRHSGEQLGWQREGPLGGGREERPLIRAPLPPPQQQASSLRCCCCCCFLPRRLFAWRPWRPRPSWWRPSWGSQWPDQSGASRSSR